MVAARTSLDSKAAIIYDMSARSFFGEEYINTIAIVGGVIGFWGGIFVLGIIYLFLVCIRRCRKHSATEGSGGAVVRAMMGTYNADGLDGRPANRSDLQPRERKAKKAHHHANFYSRGPKRRDQDSGGMSLGRLGKLGHKAFDSIFSRFLIKLTQSLFKSNTDHLDYQMSLENMVSYWFLTLLCSNELQL